MININIEQDTEKKLKYILSFHTNKDIVFRIVGIGPLRHCIEKLTTKYNNVLYLGYLNKEKLVVEYNRSHVILITSKIENMPLTLLEASSCGLPVVTSAVPGVIDVIETIKHGIFVRSNNIEDYIKGIIYFYKIWKEHPELYFEIRRQIRKRLITNYDWNIIVNKIEKMFKNVLR